MNEKWDKIRYDAFLNAIGEVIQKHCGADAQTDTRLLEVAQELVERFEHLYGDEAGSVPRKQLQQLVKECIKQNN